MVEKKMKSTGFSEVRKTLAEGMSSEELKAHPMLAILAISCISAHSSPGSLATMLVVEFAAIDLKLYRIRCWAIMLGCSDR